MAILLQSTVYVRTFPMYLTGTKTPATGKTVVVSLSKAGAAFGAAAGAVAEISAGWYKVSLTTADTNTLGDLAYNCTNVDCDPTGFTDQIGAVPANVIQIDGNATSGNNATLNLKQINVVNNAGDAIVAASTGGNGSGIAASGNGSGNGLAATAGITGTGLLCLGGATSGPGAQFLAFGGNSNGMGCQGFGAGSGISVTGGASGNGLAATGGSTGHGFLGLGGATSGSGMFLVAVGSGTGLSASGAGNGNGMQVSGNGSGSGLAAIAGTTGHGLAALGGAASGHGILAGAQGSGSGIRADGVGSVSLLATQGISGPLDAATYNAMADAVLVRNWQTTDTSSAPNYCTINALRANRNWEVSGSTYRVFKENGTSEAWTATLTTDAAGAPVVALDSN